MSEKRFLEVFQRIQLNKKTEEYFSDVMVTGVEYWKNARVLHINIESSHLISKGLLEEAEQAIARLCFESDDRQLVEIHERYLLSTQYNTENLMHIYWDSLLYDLNKTSSVNAQLVKNSEYTVDNNMINFKISAGMLATERLIEIRRFIEDVFLKRFGMAVVVNIQLITREDKDADSPLKKINSSGTGSNAADGNEDENGAGSDAADDYYAAMAENEIEENESRMIDDFDMDANAVYVDSSMLGDMSEGYGNGAAKGKRRRNAAPQEKRDYKANYEKFSRSKRDDPECFYGKNVEGDVVDIGSISNDYSGEVVVRGQIFAVEEKDIKNGEKYVITVGITDFTDSINFKLFVNAADKAELLVDICEGAFVKVKGSFGFDPYSSECTIQKVNGVKIIPDFRSSRKDEAPEKRVELHLHTNFSDLDAVTDVGAAIKRAVKWGHKAVAITDHGVVQAFPVANHVKIPDDFKIIYGLEGYFVDDRSGLVTNGHSQSLDTDYVVFDIETTGLSFKFCKIIEIGAVRIDKDGKEIGRFSEFINPEVPIPYHIEKLTSINDNMVKDADTVDIVLPRFLEFCKGAVLVAHNATFDTTFIRTFAERLNLEYDFTSLDTMTLAHVFLPELGRYTLDRLCSFFKFKNQHHHRACDDADVTAKIFLELMKMVREAGAENVDDLNKIGESSPDTIRKAKSYHGIILVKNETGRVNLYRLVSDAHIKYFNRRPRIPMSEIEKYREGLIIGSACSSGQLYSSILDGASDEELGRLVNFFDYLEIQPVGNNQYLIDNPKEDRINSVEDLQNINRQIIELGEKYDKPVVATGDVHFLDPEDAIYRTIIQEGSVPGGGGDKKKSEEELAKIAERHKDFVAEDGSKITPVQVEMKKQPPLYFKTTEEMLQEFEYLGAEKAKEVVITNTNMIADMIDKISPVRPDKCPPVIENSDKILREICENKAHEIYGPELPEIVRDRLDRELDSIIGNGYSVMYVIAQKLVWKSNDDGYLVGSRGSVGSSFAATMAGITEVNPLPPHYICPHCYYTEFDSERVNKYADAGTSGCDMPDADCPKCGTKMIKEGHDIPFETFLGFEGDKEPDIDLNFSGEYQPNAHAYIEEIFGKEHAFRAGTIGTLAEKTCIGYALRYCENRDIKLREAELTRLAKGCEGVKRTTGQHPGGMIVSPANEEIYSFTPIQHPANDMTTDTVTTHFEYHSIDHNLLKFDILGHDDPTMIRRLEDLTGIKATTVPLDDKKVMSLFHGTEALGITPEQIGGTRLGCLGIPEFGTDFAMQMVIDADPENFSDLVRIAGLAHGTDVWLGNAQTLIQEGKCKLASAICCRDDIMVYLIRMGIDPKQSFNIMEKVRKGQVAGGKVDPATWDAWSQDMLSHGVPDWYVWSCSKIKYMFPKAHAVAYVMMAWRVAFYKLYHPLAYYAAFFSIRATAFSYEIMCQGKEHLANILAEYRAKDSNQLSAKDKDLIRDMRLVQEMYERGYEFLPIDIYKADATRFQIIDGKIMPSLASIDGMGEKAAAQLAEVSRQGEFLSREEIRNRAKVSNTVVEKMFELGILGDLPETSQLKFDFI